MKDRNARALALFAVNIKPRPVSALTTRRRPTSHAAIDPIRIDFCET
jgi:hypothetical protein